MSGNWEPKVGDVVRITVFPVVGFRKLGDLRGRETVITRMVGRNTFFVDIQADPDNTTELVYLVRDECEYIGDLASLAWHAERANQKE